MQSLPRSGVGRAWQVSVFNRNNSQVSGRLCAVRKTSSNLPLAQEKIRRKANKNGRTIKPETLEYAKYIILFTTFPEDRFSPVDVLEWYRLRWQVEFVFKRFKSLAQLGHLPKYDDESAKAWLYGKLFVALIIEKLIVHAFHLPLGMSLGKIPNLIVRGENSSLLSTKSVEPLNPSLRYWT